ncbi:hypothetical protein BY458DRAFT_564755 [Sporodiniella umbellata]|nr:hypothetical protein BY458DRAFT_564755 [Sporodiniella umbellata]
MAKSLFSRMLGLFSPKAKTPQTKSAPQSVKVIENTLETTLEDSSQPDQMEQQLTAKEFFIDQQNNNEEGDEPDMTHFIKTQGDHPQFDDYLKKVKQHINNDDQSEYDEYSTVSSLASSAATTMEDALFSHISSDSRTEISNFSSINPKIGVRAQLQNNRNSGMEQYSVVDLRPPQNQVFCDTEIKNNGFYSTAAAENNYERYFCNMYTQALYYLSPKNQGYSPAYAFQLFKTISNEGSDVYKQLDNPTKKLVALSQYRAGRMLYEAHYSEQDDTYNHHQQDALMYLIQSQENGNARATYTMGVYAEECGKVNEACQFYYNAHKAGVLEAKVAFGRIFLLHYVPGFEAEEAIEALNEASNEEQLYAPLTLAMYYDREAQFDCAVKCCERVKIPLGHPMNGYANYIVSCIYLRAGFLNLAYTHMARSAKSIHFDEKGLQFKSAVALRKLGIFCLLGVGAPRNPTDAFEYIKEAARLNDRAATIVLAYMLTFGIGCSINREAALAIYEQYKGSSIAARLSCGLMWININPERAYQEFLSVIDFPSTSVYEDHWNVQAIKCEAAVRIAVWTFNGIGGAKKDPYSAVLRLQELSNQQNYTGAHYWLAWAYLEGVKDLDGSTILAKDQNKAFYYFLKGAEKNHDRCLYHAGRMLQGGYNGHNKYRNQDAFQFFLKSAALDCAKAQTQVGVAYFHGTAPVTQNLDKAFEYFTLAARHNDTEAVIYLADYLFKNSSKSNHINVVQVYSELSRAASKNNPAAYRMLGLVVDGNTDLPPTYEPILKKVSDEGYHELWNLYQQSRVESSNDRFHSRFSLYCLWKALELGDFMSGRYICKKLPVMSDDDIVKTINLFERSEGSVPSRMSLSLAKFLGACNKKKLSLKKYFEVAKCNDLNTTCGWESRLELAKLILLEKQGKARNKSLMFSYLNSMVKYNVKSLFWPYILLAKCHEEEICAGCNKALATAFYEKALPYRTSHDQASDSSPDTLLEITTRVKLLKHYYETYQDDRLLDQLDTLDSLLKKLGDTKPVQESASDSLYYRGLLILHNNTMPNNREKAEVYLSESFKLGNILARLELGYLYATTKGQEEVAEECFSEVEESKKTSIDFQGRLAETMVSLRSQRIKNPVEDYPKEIFQMRLAATVTYSMFNMERQAIDWLREISYEPLSQILLMYYKMKMPDNRTPQTISRLSDLMAPFETNHSLDYSARMILSYGQFRLGQCFELGHGVPVDEFVAIEYYNKACAFLKSNEVYEKLAEICQKNGSDNAADMFPTLYNAAQNNKDATFRLAQYYEAQKNKDSLKKALKYYQKAADLGHTESCYYYAKYRIKKTLETSIRQEGAASSSKIAADYLQIAANKNHGPSYYELAMLEIKAGLFEEAVDNLKEADYLNCSDASYQLGDLYFTGFIGVIQNHVTFKMNQNYQSSFDYFMRAYQNNPNHVMAMIRIGTFYEQGVYQKQDLLKAKQWYLKAYSLNEANGLAEYALGCLEETNIDLSGLIPTNSLRKVAYDWFVKSDTLGNKDAKFKVGIFLLNRWVDSYGPDSEKKGLDILIEENNNSELKAMIVLAKHFEEKGEYQTAFNYWRNAEMLEDPEALEHISKCYEEGLLGQKINHEKALSYKKRAIEARKHAKETQCSVMGFQSDYSEERL